MSSKTSYIKWFRETTIKDIPSVGGKNASLGEMFRNLTKKGIMIPNGFAITADGYRKFLQQNGLEAKIKTSLKGINGTDVKKLASAGKKIREMILKAEIPWEISREILSSYRELTKNSGKKILSVAVRSSATAEDLPDASFAGQQETYLNVIGDKALLVAVKKCMASLFTDRAISYRIDKGFDHLDVALSVCVQEMVRSDIGQSGVVFTLDTESGFTGAVLVSATYGLGEYVVQGEVVPDQYFVFKEGVRQGYDAIISRRLGSKEVKLVYQKEGGTKQAIVDKKDREKFCLNDKDVLLLASWAMKIEDHYGHPMDIEWARDGETGKMFIVQARSETVKTLLAKKSVIETYKLKQKGKVLTEGLSIGQKIGVGKARIIDSPAQMKEFKKGEVLITRITDPDWEPIMKIAAAIVTEQGGKTSHAAIVSRELGVPCVVGAEGARKKIKMGQEVTVSCAEGEVGYVYDKKLPYEVNREEIKEKVKTKTKIMMNVGDPDSAFSLAHLQSDGVGLAREEFIFTNFIKIHPMALINYDKIKDKSVKEKIDKLTLGYKNKTEYCVDKLAEGIAFIASAFYPNDVIVRLSDFKTNEYATLIGGADYEPKEENPMLGWRGASRYYDPKYKEGFKLECLALKKVRETWGLKNVIVMVPFCRTVDEGKKVLDTMKEFGLEKGKNGLQVYVMCEIPSNVILADEFSKIFDGFSIGSNDLTQLTLGVDRDSSLVSHIYDENNEAVKKLIRNVIKTAHKNGCKVGICGQAPSDYPKFAEFLVEEGIDSISLNPDTVLKTGERIAQMEKKIHHTRYGQTTVDIMTKMFIVMGVVAFLLVFGAFVWDSFSEIGLLTEKIKMAKLSTFIPFIKN
ncbi:MAG TPA: phosphoenolpyruvate synthase [Candidatus Magasanikbacteria bacterium]|nr:phosphoenolpyruvate synthase [Candidatus Magasanikbacteria bacterium]